ncbi:phosphopantetheine-binding protein [Syntrophus aciditrophicus]|uniref:Acyl carrier protein n=1 Tax=Syntrophus aciditrophicus (strain SB) TaxID=56780 RepID=Q2LQF4_SYNAS|nr:phosphopantetheine-binding protein [Syntrophus aciditrophicus]ABC76079.1 acyl carrier protein [Syntrophus aciditrophicus SB]OPY17915.1 MAG: acyl carrier protein [Syntrophus sp. PtaB.Bin075]
MDLLTEISAILVETLDLEEKEITGESRLRKDLDIESIDMLELALSFSSRFGIEVEEDEIFLQKVPLLIAEAEQEGREAAAVLADRFPFLAGERIREILSGGQADPKVQDLVDYIAWRLSRAS